MNDFVAYPGSLPWFVWKVHSLSRQALLDAAERSALLPLEIEQFEQE
jgi:hypothetical protein